MSGFTPDVSLLALFARSVATRPDAPALYDSAGKAMTYSEVSNAVTNLANELVALALPPKSSVALLLPNGHELAISVLAVLQSGHIAVPMPVAWRKSDLVRACREAEAAALITTENFVLERLPQLAAEVAIEVFELSFPCAFGSSLPDGIIPLRLSTAETVRPITTASSLGIATMQAAPSGISFVTHADDELLAAGLGVLLAADIQSGDRMVSAVSLCSFAGLAGALVPWLLSGGTLRLVCDIPRPEVLSDQERCHLVAPVRAAFPIAEVIACNLASLTAVHFGGTVISLDFSAVKADRVVDLTALGESAVVAFPRSQFAHPIPIPAGPVFAGTPAAGSPVILETSVSEAGAILVRGAQVPRSVQQSQPWLDTGFAATPQQTGLHAKQFGGNIAVGALRFNFQELERRILSATLVSGVAVVSDPLLGDRVVVESNRPQETMQALLDAGLPRVIAASVEKAETLQARSA